MSRKLAEQVGAKLKAHGLMLVTAESCTGGGVAQAITDVAGSSAWFERGFITYSNRSKQEMLGVCAVTLDQFGAVSEATVREMVTGALHNSDAPVALAVSGVAGPGGGTVEKPVGTVWFAWSVQGDVTRTACHHFLGSRTEIRTDAIRVALQGVLDLLEQRTMLA